MSTSTVELTAEDLIRSVWHLAAMKRSDCIPAFLGHMIGNDESELRDAVLVACYPTVQPRFEHEVQLIRAAYLSGELSLGRSVS